VGDLVLTRLTAEERLLRIDLEPTPVGLDPIDAALPQFLSSSVGLAERFLSENESEFLLLVASVSASEPGSGLGIPNHRLYRAVIDRTAGGPTPTFQEIAQFSDGDGRVLFNGLATLGDELYASGFETAQPGPTDSPWGVTRLNASTGEITPVASFGVELADGLASSSERGTLFVIGALDNEFTPSTGLFAGDIVAIEFDPRNQLIVDGAFGGTGAFALAEGAVIDPTVDVSRFLDDEGFSGGGMSGGGSSGGDFFLGGLAFVDNSLFVATQEENTNNVVTTQLVEIDFTQGLGNSTPRVLSIRDLGPEFGIGLTNVNAGGSLPPPVTLFDPGPMGIDTTTIDPLFANMAYNDRALESGVVTAIFTEHFIRTAQDPIGCASSNLLNMIPQALSSHVNERAGVGRASFDLRQPLDGSHPCRGAAGAVQ